MCLYQVTFGVQVTVFELQALKVYRKFGLSPSFSLPYLLGSFAASLLMVTRATMHCYSVQAADYAHEDP